MKTFDTAVSQDEESISFTKRRRSANVLVVTDLPGLSDEMVLLATVAGADAAVVPVAQARGEWLRDGMDLHGWDPRVVLLGPDALAAAPHSPADMLTSEWVLLGSEDHQEALLAVAARLPRMRIAIIPFAMEWLGSFLTELSRRNGESEQITFMGLAGGVGTSTTAALFAARCAGAGQSVVLVDADPLSGGIWERLSREPHQDSAWESLNRNEPVPWGVHIAEVLPHHHGVSVLTWSPEASGRGVAGNLPADFVAETIHELRSAYDCVVVDAGRISPTALQLAESSEHNVLVAHAVGLASGQTDVLITGARFGAVPRRFGLAILGPHPKGFDAYELLERTEASFRSSLPLSKRVATMSAQGRVFEASTLGAVRPFLDDLAFATFLSEDRHFEDRRYFDERYA
ncbi:hypothetical protein [Neomicrococcus aestuarii]|uniref:hypothetical protein n=1 Tax=Neomicrococcus aestuarii TaxID=556325 RepID=UPI0012EE53F9|nr:hypothetical protein [Neomicrococcus aestuarii]